MFENAYCNLPMCGPSRASLHAGRLPFSIAMYDNASEFMASIPTFTHYLRDLGYRTELAGKMHFVGVISCTAIINVIPPKFIQQILLGLSIGRRAENIGLLI